MSGTGRALLTAILLVVAIATGFSAANFEPPQWAYPATPRDFKPDPADTDTPVPALAGRSPTYILRQLYDVQSGARSGKTVELMKPIVAAYSASKMP